MRAWKRSRRPLPRGPRRPGSYPCRRQDGLHQTALSFDPVALATRFVGIGAMRSSSFLSRSLLTQDALSLQPKIGKGLGAKIIPCRYNGRSMPKKERTNEQWLAELRPPPRDEALADLRVLLVRGLGAALGSRRDVSREAVEDFAQEALVKVLGNLGSFRGESRFTTWAQKISVRVALTELRRLRWRDVSLDEALERHEQTGSRKDAFADEEPTPEELSARADALALVRKFIDQELTDKQRAAMTVVMFEGMPLEEAARRMGTNRGALYKLMHDARKRLKRRMEEEGLSPEELLAAFAEG